MQNSNKGQLVPSGGGDIIPLLREKMVLGRRDNCDIRLRFPNVSSVHCELAFQDGFWHIRDLNSTNGIKVNRERVQERVLRPGDEITIAKRHYTIDYELAEGAVLPESDADEIMGASLMERAGLVNPNKKKTPVNQLRPQFEDIDIDWDEEIGKQRK